MPIDPQLTPSSRRADPLPTAGLCRAVATSFLLPGGSYARKPRGRRAPYYVLGISMKDTPHRRTRRRRHALPNPVPHLPALAPGYCRTSTRASSLFSIDEQFLLSNADAHRELANRSATGYEPYAHSHRSSHAIEITVAPAELRTNRREDAYHPPSRQVVSISFREWQHPQEDAAGSGNIENVISFAVMNSSRAGVPSSTWRSARWIAGTISPGSVTRSP